MVKQEGCRMSKNNDCYIILYIVIVERRGGRASGFCFIYELLKKTLQCSGSHSIQIGLLQLVQSLLKWTMNIVALA